MGIWGRTHGLGLERLNSLDLRAHVVRDGLEVAEDLLGLVDDSLVTENRTVVLEVDGRRLGSELALDALGIGVPLAERLEGRNSLCRRGGMSIGSSSSETSSNHRREVVRAYPCQGPARCRCGRSPAVAPSQTSRNLPVQTQ